MSMHGLAFRVYTPELYQGNVARCSSMFTRTTLVRASVCTRRRREVRWPPDLERGPETVGYDEWFDSASCRNTSQRTGRWAFPNIMFQKRRSYSKYSLALLVRGHLL